jgi:hypothetical protein
MPDGRTVGSKLISRHGPSRSAWTCCAMSVPTSIVRRLAGQASQRNGSTASTASSLSIVPRLTTWYAGRCCRRRNRSRSPREELAKRGPDFLEQEIAQRVANAPQRWTMVVTVANPGDPTADPSAEFCCLTSSVLAKKRLPASRPMTRCVRIPKWDSNNSRHRTGVCARTVSRLVRF